MESQMIVVDWEIRVWGKRDFSNSADLVEFAGPERQGKFDGVGASQSANLYSGSTYMSNSNVTREWLIATATDVRDGRWLDRNDQMASKTKPTNKKYNASRLCV
jgi:hypothetical protein